MRLDMVFDHAATQTVVKLQQGCYRIALALVLVLPLVLIRSAPRSGSRPTFEEGPLTGRRNNLHANINIVADGLRSFHERIPAQPEALPFQAGGNLPMQALGRIVFCR
jgi:hypothetical protein